MLARFHIIKHIKMLFTWNSRHVKFISDINVRQYMVKPSTTKTISNMTERQTGKQREREKYDPKLSMSGNKRIVNMIIIQVIWMAVRMITPLTLCYQERQL